MLPTHGVHRHVMVELDKRNTEILTERMRLLDAQPGPRVGDYVRLPDGKLHRFSHRWDASENPSPADVLFQTSSSGSWYLGDGWCSFSGGLDPSIPLSEIQSTDETCTGQVWFFDHNWAEANNALHVNVPFRVFTVTNPKYRR